LNSNASLALLRVQSNSSQFTTTLKLSIACIVLASLQIPLAAVQVSSFVGIVAGVQAPASQVPPPAVQVSSFVGIATLHLAAILS
jgi:hypothetical protein